MIKKQTNESTTLKIVNIKQNNKILIVDDDEGILDAISLILQDAGYVVKTMLDGNETYKAVEKFKPNLILLDVLLSGSDGREICKKLKDDPLTEHIPIIIISAHPTAKKSIKKYKANAFLAKPFESKTLLKLIIKHIH